MTKQNIIKEIQAKEAELWREIAEYDNMFAPVEGSSESHHEWNMNDDGHISRVHAWKVVHEILDAIVIQTDHNNADGEAAHEFMTDLFVRRQAARGIYYN